MKKILLVFIILTIGLRLPGQTNLPARLALVSESAEAAGAVDVLTAELTSHTNLQLLERNEIEKVYREQGLSTENKDYLKLGQVLGADGLLLMETASEGTNQFLNIRLVAVKPGVVLTAEKFAWPITSLAEWSPAFARHLDLFVPKLTVLVKDAIPLSVVNLRSAIGSGAGLETERQLKLLTIQRLSREPQYFVLERQRMELMTEEKDLKLDESAFWNGSYLLEGVVDQNGYSETNVAINARLTPPKGGTPLEFQASGSRTNLAEVVNHLAASMNAALKVNSAVPEWNAADEAAQYYNEAKWAMRWGVFTEARAAADSAWALGEQDMDCAITRIKTYEGPRRPQGYYNGFWSSPRSTNDVIQDAVKDAEPNPAWGLTLRAQDLNGFKQVEYVYAEKLPDPASIDLAEHALELYYQFGNTTPKDPLKTTSEQAIWRNSEWYDLGIKNLVEASTILQDFNFVPDTLEPVADKLAKLRRMARQVAGRMAQSLPAYDSNIVGDHPATRDERPNLTEDETKILTCKLKWGCFWQETPEDCIALYRELMSSVTFCKLHKEFWFRPLQRPRVVAWNENDRQRLAKVWDSFMEETSVSTNVVMRMEGKAMKIRNANDFNETTMAVTNYFEALLENRRAFITNNAEALLDAEDLGTPMLFEGPGHSLRVSTNSKIFTWTGSDWREDSATPPASYAPAISTDGVLFQKGGFNLSASIYGLATETNLVEFLLGQKKQHFNVTGIYRPDTNALPEPQPLWKLPPGLALENLPAAWRQPELFLLVDHSKLQQVVNEQHFLTQEKVLAEDGYNAALLCFIRDLPLPQKLFLKFDDPDGCPPVTGIDPGTHFALPTAPSDWMLFSPDFLIFGMEKSNVGYKTGIWLMPATQLEEALAGPRQIQLEQLAQAAAAANQARKDLLAKYDLNHNGIIDGDEREAAMDDPAFIESELDVIDANHNGWLDAAELSYFDANHNKVLEPKEQAGIDIAQHLFAVRLLEKFDVNDDGVLDYNEFDSFWRYCVAASFRYLPAKPWPDANHDNRIDTGELESFLKGQTIRGLWSKNMPNLARMNQGAMNPNQTNTAQALFKARVEAYWQNQGDGANRVTGNDRNPPGSIPAQTSPAPPQ